MSLPPSQFQRALSLLRTGPRGLFWRLADQLVRKASGRPLWRVSQVSPLLYLGGQHSSRGWAAMQARGIQAIVNLREAHKDDAALGIAPTAYLHLPTPDNTPPSLDDLARGARFIAQHIERGQAVYVHCGVGVGRAPSQVAAYLISTGLSADEALEQIRRVRPFIHLTRAQRQQLERYAERQHGSIRSFSA
ncbi:MAG: dual specificity protein phosphatase family protein [Anaerolineae bacterium]|nr:dual specificity protein phosphatase family protein [Anaerolineae bacterium]MDW8173770.1 dual specificity protein phosphatase [Anaerolineae bacterium]